MILEPNQRVDIRSITYAPRFQFLCWTELSKKKYVGLVNENIKTAQRWWGRWAGRADGAVWCTLVFLDRQVDIKWVCYRNICFPAVVFSHCSHIQKGRVFLRLREYFPHSDSAVMTHLCSNQSIRVEKVWWITTHLPPPRNIHLGEMFILTPVHWSLRRRPQWALGGRSWTSQTEKKTSYCYWVYLLRAKLQSQCNSRCNSWYMAPINTSTTIQWFCDHQYIARQSSDDTWRYLFDWSLRSTRPCTTINV